MNFVQSRDIPFASAATFCHNGSLRPWGPYNAFLFDMNRSFIIKRVFGWAPVPICGTGFLYGLDPLKIVPIE